MAETINKFVWYDLMTSDVRAAAAFYTKVVGWGSINSGMVESEYHLFTLDKTMIAGLMPIPPHAAGASPTWMGYIGVDDVDAYETKVTEAGGKVLRPAEDIPNNVGRFAIVADPGGAGFMLFKPNGTGEAPGTDGTPGHMGWNELHAGDLETAWSFYTGLFGWDKSSSFDMGPMGEYRIFTMGGNPAGGMMTKMPEAPTPSWLFYFNVDGIDAAISRVTEAGGQVINGPVEVPGGQWIMIGMDPQGAMFALVAPGR